MTLCSAFQSDNLIYSRGISFFSMHCGTPRSQISVCIGVLDGMLDVNLLAVLLLSPTGVVLPHTCRSPPVYLGEIPKADEIGRAPSCPSTSSCRLQHTTNLHCQYFSQERQAQIPLFLSSTTTELNYSTHRDQELRRESSCCDVHMGSNPVLTIQEHRERLPGENRINCIIIFHCESKIWHVWKKKCWCITAISAHSIQAKATSKFSITNFTLPLISSQRKFSSMISTELLNPIMYFAYK